MGGGRRRRAPAPAHVHLGKSLVSRWPRLNWSLLPGLLTFPLVAILCIAFFGAYEGNIERLTAKLQTHAHTVSSMTYIDSILMNKDIAQVWTRSVTDNIQYTLGFHAGRAKRTTSEMLLAVTDRFMLLVVLWFYMQVFLKAFGLNWLTLSPLSIVPLFFLATDMYRWGALAITNMFIVSLVMIKRGIAVHDPEFASPRLSYWGRRLWLLGPFGDHWAYGRRKMADAFEVLQRYFAG